MAILFTDPGGEYYFSSGVNVAGVWNSTTGFSLVSTAPVGRLTQYGCQQNNNPSFLQRLLGVNYVETIAGAAIYVPAGGFTANTALMQFYDGATLQVDFRVDASNHITITRNGTILATSTSTIVNGSGWHYFEFQAKIDGSAGSAQVWIDGVSWVSVSGANTKNSANAFTNKVQFTASTPTASAYFKDMYILETPSGGGHTARLGDVQVAVVYPNAAGVHQQWSNTGGASQTASVQDGRSGSGTRPDGDTSYISDSTAGDISDFAHDTLSAGSILGVVHTSYARSDVGTANFQQVAISGPTVHYSATIPAGNTYNYYFDVLENDPNTGVAWTVSNFNSATFGAAIPALLPGDEDYWQNPVRPAPAKGFVVLPLGDQDDIHV